MVALVARMHDLVVVVEHGHLHGGGAHVDADMQRCVGRGACGSGRLCRGVGINRGHNRLGAHRLVGGDGSRSLINNNLACLCRLCIRLASRSIAQVRSTFEGLLFAHRFVLLTLLAPRAKSLWFGTQRPHIGRNVKQKAGKERRHILMASPGLIKNSRMATSAISSELSRIPVLIHWSITPRYAPAKYAM